MTLHLIMALQYKLATLLKGVGVLQKTLPASINISGVNFLSLLGLTQEDSDLEYL